MEKNEYFFEIWRPIYGYEGWYEVSNFGRVRSLGRIINRKQKGSVLINERILKPILHSNGYYAVSLYKDKSCKIFSIHRLVAIAFIPNPLNLPYINHKDENTANNCVWNLEWCTHIYNCNYGTAIERRIEKQKNGKGSKKILCIDTNIIYQSLGEIERQLGFSKGTISNCCNGRQNRAYKLHWKFVE